MKRRSSQQSLDCLALWQVERSPETEFNKIGSINSSRNPWEQVRGTWIGSFGFVRQRRHLVDQDGTAAPKISCRAVVYKQIRRFEQYFVLCQIANEIQTTHKFTFVLNMWLAVVNSALKKTEQQDWMLFFILKYTVNKIVKRCLQLLLFHVDTYTFIDKCMKVGRFS